MSASTPERTGRGEDAAALEKALAAAAPGGRISCREAFRVAAALGHGPVEAGRAIERLGLKITACQLGCFR